MIFLKRLFWVTSGVTLLFLLFYYLTSWVGPGRFPNVEIYHFNIDQERLNATIRKFKIENHEYVVLENPELIDTIDDFSHRYYVFYFQMRNPKEIMMIWTHKDGKNKSKLALVSVNDGSELTRWKKINADFGFWENRKQKTLFESEILDPIRAMVDVEKKTSKD